MKIKEDGDKIADSPRPITAIPEIPEMPGIEVSGE
jgi:hypothetical protein